MTRSFPHPTKLKPSHPMKTKLTLLLALALSAESATAASPNLPVIKPSALPSQSIRPAAKVPSIPMQRSNVFAPVVRPAVPMIKPRARPAPSSYLPKMPAIRPMVPQHLQPRSGGRSTSRRGTSAAPSTPATFPGKSPASRNLPAKPQVEIRKVIPGLNLPNASALREGREIVEGLKALDSLRNSGFQNLMPEGLSGNGNRGPAGPSDPFTNHGTGMRDPKAPGHVSGRRSGLTDIRGSAGRGTRGYQGDGQQERGGASPNDVSRTGESIFSAGRESRFGRGSGFSGSASEPSYERNEENGDIIMSVNFTHPDGTHGRYSVTEHHNNDGSVSGTTEHTAVEKPNSSVTSTEVKRDATGGVVAQGRVVVNPDGSGGESGTASGTPGPQSDKPGARSIDRSNGDVSMGGPVNGSGPSVAQAAGLVSLDLLRQTADGAQSGGGANYMTTGRIDTNQVRPIGSEGQTGIGGNENPVPVNLGSTVVLPGPITGGGGNPE